jgi:transcriptional regulator with XRE-family HTH domain
MPVSAVQIGELLREARKAHGEYSAEQAAVKVGTTGRTMGTWERGEVAPPSDTFLTLVQLYRAEKKLLVLVGTWEKFRGGGAGGAGRQSRAGGE